MRRRRLPPHLRLNVPLQKFALDHLDNAAWLRYLLSNRLKTRRFQGEQRDIQEIRCAFTRGRCGRAVLRHRTRARPAKDHHRLVRQGLLQVRGRRAAGGDQEVRGQDRHQGRTVAIRHSGHDPEDGGGAGFRHRARRRLFRQLRRAGAGQVGLRGQARGPLRHHDADEVGVRAEHAGDASTSTTTSPRRRPITASR